MGVRGAVAATAAVICWFNLPAPCVAAPVKSTVESVVVMLQSGVGGDEIQMALDSLPNSGGEVVLPEGEFLISRPIVLQRSRQTLRGAGDATILRLAAHANCPVIIMGEPVNHPRHTLKQLCVSHLIIDGNRRQQQRELWRLEGEGSPIRHNRITRQNITESPGGPVT